MYYEFDEQTDVLLIKRRRTVPKIMGIGSGVLKVKAENVNLQTYWVSFLVHPIGHLHEILVRRET